MGERIGVDLKTHESECGAESQKMQRLRRRVMQSRAKTTGSFHKQEEMKRQFSIGVPEGKNQLTPCFRLLH